jgi:hypothetical protein
MTAPTISTLPTAPARTQDQTTFRINADNFVAAQQPFVDEANVLGTWMNDNTSTIVGIGTGYVGNWSDQTGAANIPYSTAHNGAIWVLVSNVADITLSEPSGSNSDWISTTDGNIVYSNGEYTLAGDATITGDVNLADSGNNSGLITASWNGSNYFANFGRDASTFFQAWANGARGIGTSSPVLPLSVEGDVWIGNGAEAEIGRIFNDAGVLHLRASTNVTGLALGTNGSEKVRIDSNGNVGIGTSTPSALTDITGVGIGGRGLRITETSASKSTGVYTLEIDSSAQTSNTTASGAMRVSVNSGDAMVINGLGNVGIGTDSPGSQFHLLGFNGGNGIADFERTGGAKVRVNAQSAVGQVGTVGSHNLQLITNSTNRMTIDTTGNVGIGTDSPEGGLHVLRGAPGAESKFYFQNGSTAAGCSTTIGLYPNNGTNRGAEIQALATSPNITDLVFKTNQSGSAPVERMRIDSTGNTTFGGAVKSTETSTYGGALAVDGNWAVSSSPSVGCLLQGKGSLYDVSIYSGAGNIIAGFADDLSATFGGNILPGTDNANTLASASFRMSELFSANGTINTSDETQKTTITALTVDEKAAYLAVKNIIGSYKWLDAVDKKGESARIHVGVGAQSAIVEFTSRGLDWKKYACFCLDDIEVYGAQMVTESQQVTVTKTRETTTIEVIGGVPTQVTKTEDYEEPVFEDVAVVDADGNPVTQLVESGEFNTVSVLDEDGEPVTEMVDSGNVKYVAIGQDDEGNDIIEEQPIMVEQAVTTQQPAMVEQTVTYPIPVMQDVEVEKQVLVPAGQRYGIRYNELIMGILASI